MMMLLSIKQHLSNIEAQFIKKLSNTEVELKKALLVKKSVYNNKQPTQLNVSIL